MTSAAATYAAGDVVAEKFRIVAPRDRGAMGAVYQAESLASGHRVALAIIAGGPDADDAVIQRLLADATVGEGLSNPHTIKVIDAGHLPQGDVYVATQEAGGTRLDLRIAELAKTGAAIEEDQALAIGIQVLGSLAEAHLKGMLHGRLSPECVFLDQDAAGQLLVRVHGLGAARSTAPCPQPTNPLWNAESCMSPEVWNAVHAGPPADIYSVGCILLGCVAGRPPFLAAKDPKILRSKHCFEGAPDLRSLARGPVSEVFALAVKTALAKDPAARHADARAMRQALEAVTDGAWGRATSNSRVPIAAMASTSLSGQFMAQHKPPSLEEVRGSTSKSADPPKNRVALVAGIAAALLVLILSGTMGAKKTVVADPPPSTATAAPPARPEPAAVAAPGPATPTGAAPLAAAPTPTP